VKLILIEETFFISLHCVFRESPVTRRKCLQSNIEKILRKVLLLYDSSMFNADCTFLVYKMSEYLRDISDQSVRQSSLDCEDLRHSNEKNQRFLMNLLSIVIRAFIM